MLKVANNPKVELKGEDTFVKENHMLSPERVTVFMQVLSNPNINLNPECSKYCKIL